MLNDFKQLNSRKVTLLLVVVFVAFLIFQLALYFSRLGETRLTIEVIPSDSIVLINGEETSPGNLYLSPGEYTLSAEKEGWATDTQTVVVGSESLDVELLPEPDSNEAIRWLEDNPEIQLDREALGATKANRQGQILEQENPIIPVLPFTDIGGPFTVDYGLSSERENSIFIIISDSSPGGRQNALKWIRQNAQQDPTDLEIRFADFNNPLATTPDRERNYID